MITRSLVRDFQRDGFLVLPSILSECDVLLMREEIEQRYTHLMSQPECPEQKDGIRGGVSLMRMFEVHAVFRDLIEKGRHVDLVEEILGDDCHVVAQNAIRTPHGKGIVNWHVDDELYFPFLSDLDRDVVSGLGIPCYALNVMVVLSDVPSNAHGPTQVVPGSHLSGRRPDYRPDLDTGIPVRSLHARAGDAYLVNSQTWHRGGQNHSDRTRYLVSTTYGRRFVSQRFYPFLNYQMPDEVLTGASDRLRRLLGGHGKGPYG
jgi:ectoine hydroxylase-related dioxygenase (phytanoyl-CoA dioxygenase family)